MSLTVLRGRGRSIHRLATRPIASTSKFITIVAQAVSSRLAKQAARMPRHRNITTSRPPRDATRLNRRVWLDTFSATSIIQNTIQEAKQGSQGSRPSVLVCAKSGWYSTSKSFRSQWSVCLPDLPATSPNAFSTGTTRHRPQVDSSIPNNNTNTNMHKKNEHSTFNLPGYGPELRGR